jgi:hypothetical protein
MTSMMASTITSRPPAIMITSMKVDMPETASPPAAAGVAEGVVAVVAAGVEGAAGAAGVAGATVTLPRRA